MKFLLTTQLFSTPCRLLNVHANITRSSRRVPFLGHIYNLKMHAILLGTSLCIVIQPEGNYQGSVLSIRVV